MTFFLTQLKYSGIIIDDQLSFLPNIIKHISGKAETLYDVTRQFSGNLSGYSFRFCRIMFLGILHFFTSTAVICSTTAFSSNPIKNLFPLLLALSSYLQFPSTELPPRQRLMSYVTWLLFIFLLYPVVSSQRLPSGGMGFLSPLL